MKGGAYRTAKDAEKDSHTEDIDKRNKNLGVAIINYAETLKKMNRETTAPDAVRSKNECDRRCMWRNSAHRRSKIKRCPAVLAQ